MLQAAKEHAENEMKYIKVMLPDLAEDQYRVLRFCLRETFTAGYIKGYDDVKDMYKAPPEQRLGGRSREEKNT